MSVKPTAKVSSLHIYPIKSTAGIKLHSTKIDALGLTFDRRFVVSDLSGQFITARTEPKLCLVQTKLSPHGLTLSAPNMPTLALTYTAFTPHYQKVTVWGDSIDGQLCTEKANSWFSEYLQRPCILLFFGEDSYRERSANSDNARKLAFADGYPLLLISQASLDNLNARLLDSQPNSESCSNNIQEMVSMAQFRPNIVVENTPPFAEDTWQHIRIGDVEFKVSKPCERCVFTTINPKTGEKHPQQQPLRMLTSFRQSPHGEVLFGQNLIALNSGTINTGDELTITSKQKPPIFIRSELVTQTTTSATSNSKKVNNIENGDNLTDRIVDKSVSKKLNIVFEKWNKKYQIPSPTPNTNIQGNEQAKTLLENGEDAGLILPYSCRAGMCGRCKAKLISGEVKQLPIDGFNGLTAQEIDEGYILCCSTIAISDVVIKHT